MELLDKQIIEEEYVNNKLSETAIAKKYNTTRYLVSKAITDYGFEKNISYNSNANLTQQVFYKLYIEENKSYHEIGELFNLTERQVKRLNLNHFHCTRSDEQIKKNRLESLKKTTISEEKIKEATSKRIQTNIERYGCTNVFANNKIKEKIKKTNIEKYGYENPMQSDIIKEKVSNSLIQKSISVYNKNPEFSEIVNDKEKLKNYILSLDSNDRTIYKLAQNLEYSISYLAAKVREYQLSDIINYLTNTSHYEDEIEKFIKSLGIENVVRNSKNVLDGLELDIYIPDKNVGIEFNGDYWHSEGKVEKTYHYNKSKIAEEKGIRLIHVYEYQWNNPIKKEILKSIIKNALGKNDIFIYARECEFKVLTKKDVEDFSNKNSLHGHRNASIYLGLFYNNELVEVMTFGKAFFSKDNSINYECIRSITRLNTTVVGGMNKLFKNFIRLYNPDKVLYYVDYNTHNGNSMPNLGFEFESYSKYGLINLAISKDVADKYGYVFNRKPNKHKEIKKYIDEGKILTIYDCGVKKYIWTNNKKIEN